MRMIEWLGGCSRFGDGGRRCWLVIFIVLAIVLKYYIYLPTYLPKCIINYLRASSLGCW